MSRLRTWITLSGATLETNGADIDVTRTLGRLPGSQQQLVQISAAGGRGARILIFDEPTSSLSEVEARRLFSLIRQLKEDGITSIYVSHRMEEIFMLCDTVTVLRDGEVTGTRPAKDLDEPSLGQMMIGRPFEAYFPSHLEAEPGEELLRVEGYSSPVNSRTSPLRCAPGRFSAWRAWWARDARGGGAIFGLDPNAVAMCRSKAHRFLGQSRLAMPRGLGLVPKTASAWAGALHERPGEHFLPYARTTFALGWVRRERERQMAQSTSTSSA